MILGSKILESYYNSLEAMHLQLDPSVMEVTRQFYILGYLAAASKVMREGGDVIPSMLEDAALCAKIEEAQIIDKESRALELMRGHIFKM